MPTTIDPSNVPWIQSNWREGYRWHEWLNGDAWELTIGVDFTEPVAVFRRRVYQVAAEDGYRVRTRVKGDKFYLQQLPKT